VVGTVGAKRCGSSAGTKRHSTVTCGRASREEAAEALERTVELDPSDADAWFFRGQANFALERWDGAREAYARATDLDPERTDAWRGLAAALDALGRPHEASQARSQASQLDQA
jgi:cytochrome c-type biogenesis protein CcmH/NrfG